MSMAFESERAAAKAVVALRSPGLGPVFDGLARGALALGFLGLGVGGIAADLAHVSFDAVFQWSSAGAGAVLGAVAGLTWGLRHRG